MAEGNGVCSRSWIEQLRPIIRDFKDGSNKPLTSQEVERLSLIIRLKIDLEEGNISIDDLEIASMTYKNLFMGSYNKSKKYVPKKSRKKTLKNYK